LGATVRSHRVAPVKKSLLGCNRDFCLKYDNGGFWIAITPVSPKPAALWTKVEKILRKSGPTNAADTSKL